VNKDPFDPVRGAFLLVSLVIIVEALVVVASVGACIWHSEMIISNPDIKCDPDNRLFQLLAGALAAALAFASIRDKK
jgi:hypothetical protein